MNRILIVDDEAYFRQYLKTSFPWESLGFEICDEASNGEDALKLIPQVKPDLILADIHMTEMDGIAFAEKVKQRYSQINIILITGYNEFEYAKQAIKIGVSNFISKPFEKQELIDSVRKIKEYIVEGDEREKLIRSLRQNYSETVSLAKDAVLYKLVKSNVPIGDMANDLEKLKISLPECPAVVLVIECGFNNKAEKADEKGLKEKITDEIGKFSNIGSVVFERDGKLISISGLGEKNLYAYLKSCFDHLIGGLTKSGTATVAVGMGTVFLSYDDIAASYENATIALRNSFLLGGNHVIPYDSLEINGIGKEVYPFEFKNNLLMYLRLLDDEKVRMTMSDVYNFIKLKPVSIDFIYILYTELLSNCFSCLAEYGYETEEVFGKGFSPFEELLKKRTMNEAHEYVMSVYSEVIGFLKSWKKQNSVSAVEKAKEYIDKNYTNSGLNIDEIAANVFFHPSYLRFLFKKEMGVTINEYLTKVRMERAKQLLIKDRLNNNVVAGMVGYSDPAYFSKCFKKCFKVNPSEFEKSFSSPICRK